jgi:hypothetical protein
VTKVSEDVNPFLSNTEVKEVKEVREVEEEAKPAQTY